MQHGVSVPLIAGVFLYDIALKAAMTMTGRRGLPYVADRTYNLRAYLDNQGERRAQWTEQCPPRGSVSAVTNMNGTNLPSNRILASLPARARLQLEGQLKPITLEFGKVLYEPGREIRIVYFPLDCLVSLLTAVDKRRTLEVGMVGNEGMAGMPFILGVGVSGVRALVQGAGRALCIDAASFRHEFDRNRALQQALYRYTYALMAQVSQTAACNRFHDSGQRLARWLLMTSDRVGSDEFPLTQAFLAHMLGLRRVGVTSAASEMKRRGLIDYTRGQLRILNRKNLLRASCSCYQIVNDVFARAERA